NIEDRYVAPAVRQTHDNGVQGTHARLVVETEVSDGQVNTAPHVRGERQELHADGRIRVDGRIVEIEGRGGVEKGASLDDRHHRKRARTARDDEVGDAVPEDWTERHA